MARRIVSRRFDEWAAQVASTGFCARPIRLIGSADRFNTSTGELVGSMHTQDLPDGVMYVRCGNRRSSECPSCSREYQGDYWHLVTAGVAGGDKGVPESIASHPLVFVTLTAPSFGAVHAAKKPGSASAACHPRSRSRFCEHGTVVSCTRVHSIDDAEVGSPLCGKCYDYAGHVVWQWHASELWRRFTISLSRTLAKHLGLSENAARKIVRLQYAKVAEYQRRGAIHFHALIRLDGAATDEDAFPASPIPLTAAGLASLVPDAARSVRVIAPGVDDHDSVRALRFGVQVDARPVRHSALEHGGEISPRMVAGYLAKYVTKAAADAEPDGRSRHFGLIRDCARGLAQRACVSQGLESPYLLLAKWSRALGFRGHVGSKSRRFSTTMGRLREARRRFQRRQSLQTTGPVAELSHEDELDESTTVTLNSFVYAGSGWLTTADADLAAEAAAAAREWQVTRAHRRHTPASS
ncbi:replication initiator [Oerskovia enterophila]|uniref:replication initiator n=1 Tax=Oerskovia enterophila TaxID=43678 RepID=UPI0037F925F0